MHYVTLFEIQFCDYIKYKIVWENSTKYESVIFKQIIVIMFYFTKARIIGKNIVHKYVISFFL